MAIELDPDEFNAWIADIGQPVTWARASACPCRDPHSQAADPECGFCAGRGWTWDARVPARLALSAQREKKKWAEFGQSMEGDVICTLPSDSPCYDAGESDRVVFTESSHPFRDTRVVDADGALRLGWPLATLDRVFWQNEDNTARYTADAATIGVDASGYGVLTWAPGRQAPPPGVRVSVSGRRVPEYYCLCEFPQDRRHHSGRALPRKVVLRLFDLFGKSGAAAPGGGAGA